MQSNNDPQARSIGQTLISTLEPRLRKAAVVGGKAMPGDWRVSLESDLPDVVPLAGTSMLAPPGAAPTMEVAAGNGVNQPATPIPQLDASLLQVRIGWVLVLRRCMPFGEVCPVLRVSSPSSCMPMHGDRPAN